LRSGRPIPAAAKLAELRPRSVLRSRLDRLRDVWLPIVQVGVAAAVAYWIARHLVDHTTPFFAPIAAVLTLGLSAGQRGRRALELGFGVALGIGVADLLVLAIGAGAWQLALIVSLAMAAGVLAGGGSLLVNQAAVSAVLVTALAGGAGSYSGARFVDALIGASVALIANAVAPANPIRMVRRELTPLLEELAGIFDRLARALADGDHEAAEAALATGRADEHLVAEVRTALVAARETVTLAPPMRGSRVEVEDAMRAIDPIDYAWRNSRVLARNVRRAIELDEHIPPGAVRGIGLLADSVRALNQAILDEGEIGRAQAIALEAAREATAALADTANLSVSAIVSQVRSIAMDLLRAVGLDEAAAIAAIRGEEPDGSSRT
jgi:uncharacterized membrane protein YgaE (UPF0421/DUF939 family)